MAVAVFYHLTRSPPESVLAALLPRALAQGWRVMVRAVGQDRLQALDLALWRLDEDGFLPHGLQGGPDDADQPVLLGAGPIGNGAQGLILLDDAAPLAEELAGLERVWVLFDGNDAAAVTRARGLWTGLTASGHGAQYWSEDSGRWQMKSERPARDGAGGAGGADSP